MEQRPWTEMSGMRKEIEFKFPANMIIRRFEALADRQQQVSKEAISESTKLPTCAYVGDAG